MAPKVPLPTSGRRLAQGAVMLAIAALQDERVRAQLAKAPAAVKAWAGDRRRDESRLAELDPTRRFGQRGLNRRIAALQRNADLVFPEPHGEQSEAIHRAIDELEQAIAVSATMPLADKRRARGRITAELTRLEQALVDAVLPS